MDENLNFIVMIDETPDWFIAFYSKLIIATLNKSFLSKYTLSRDNTQKSDLQSQLTEPKLV